MAKNKIPVNDLFGYLESMYEEKWGYIYGTAGVLWTEQRQAALRSKYSEDDPNYGKSVKYGSKWIGHMVSDCSGIPVYIWSKYGLSIPHGSTSMVTQGYIVDCSPTPKPGYAALVDPTPDTPDNNHIGIVGPDGVTVYEDAGTQQGFIKSKTTDAKWTKYGRFKDVDYTQEPETILYQAEVITKTGGKNVNLRSGPGTSYPVIAPIPKGTIVDVMVELDGWDFVRTPKNGSGYMSSDYLVKVEGTEEEPDKEPDKELDDDTPVDDLPEPDGSSIPRQYWLTVLRNQDGQELIIAGSWKVVAQYADQ